MSGLAAGKKVQKSICDKDAFLNIFERLLRRLEDEEINLVACIVKQIWLRRNKLVFEGGFTPPTQLIQYTTDQVQAAIKVKQSSRIGAQKNG
jgi:hypothetical protein